MKEFFLKWRYFLIAALSILVVLPWLSTSSVNDGAGKNNEMKEESGLERRFLDDAPSVLSWNELQDGSMRSGMVFFEVELAADSSGITVAVVKRLRDGMPFRAIVPAGCNAVSQLEPGDPVRLIALRYQVALSQWVHLFVLECP